MEVCYRTNVRRSNMFAEKDQGKIRNTFKMARRSLLESDSKTSKQKPDSQKIACMDPKEGMIEPSSFHH